jgi:8-oxo-dGTP diphosphatase
VIEAVCGFFFDEARTKVALIRKKKPDWQKGKLNGVGGKIEEEEGPHTAMAREFEEETGHKTQKEDWALYFQLEDKVNGYRIWYFRANGDLDQLRTVEDEEVEIIPLGAVNMANLVHNLTWLIPMALDTTFTNGSGEWLE